MAGAAADSRGASILVVEDDHDLLDLLVVGLGELGHQVQGVDSAEQGLVHLERGEPDLALVDVNLPGMGGIEFVSRLKDGGHTTSVLVMTAFTCIDSAVQAIRAGAHDFLLKPLDIEALSIRIERILEERRHAAELQHLRTLIHEDRGFEGLLGRSPPMRRMFDLVARAGATDASVLITGESGTGKELVARALHARSKRADGKFVPVNCSAIPDQLLESELFGHLKGSFTGAQENRSGLFVEADKGTLFLDEIGEIAVELQPKLLRALEERCVRSVGSTKERAIDVRFIAATNRDLEARVETGDFREDLFFRVNVIHIPLPPLRSRGSDILLIAGQFVFEFAARFGNDVDRITPAAAAKLMGYDWPGNVRELRNSIERAVALASGNAIDVEDLPPRVREGQQQDLTISSANPEDLVTLDEVETRYIRHVLRATGGNKSRAAQILGLDRKTLHRRLKRSEESGKEDSEN